MELPPASPDTIEHVWFITKRDASENEKQYPGKDLLIAIINAVLELIE